MAHDKSDENMNLLFLFTGYFYWKQKKSEPKNCTFSWLVPTTRK